MPVVGELHYFPMLADQARVRTIVLRRLQQETHPDFSVKTLRRKRLFTKMANDRVHSDVVQGECEHDDDAYFEDDGGDGQFDDDEELLASELCEARQKFEVGVQMCLLN